MPKQPADLSDLPLPPPIAEIFETMDRLLIDGVMAGPGKESAIAAYRANNARVREVLPRDRVLVFNPADGWEPLCRFLGVSVPATPFPRSNARAEFWELFGGEPETA